jgi:hypothetical protein
MRTTLAPALTQQWLTIGLNKWHQSIAKREASRVGIRAKGLVIQWTAIEADAVSTWTTQFASTPSQSLPSQSNPRDELGSLDGPQVLLIDRSKVEHELTARKGMDLGMLSFFGPGAPFPPVFLLWDWGPSGRSSLEWATSLGFAGVIFDFSTLRSWTRVAVDRLPSKLKELHPLVATLPTLKSAQSQN